MPILPFQLPGEFEASKACFTFILDAAITQVFPALGSGNSITQGSESQDVVHFGFVLDALLAAIAEDETITHYRIESLVFDSSSKDNEKISAAVAYEDLDYYWAATFVGMEQRFVPFYEPRTSAIELEADSRTADCSFDPSDLESLLSVAAVHHTDVSGNDVVTVVRDTDDSHLLVHLGVENWGDITAKTTSEADAETLGTLALGEMGVQRVRGTVNTSRIRNAHGLLVPLSEAKCGRLITIIGEEQHVSRITAIERSSNSVKLTLDDSPYGLAKALAQLGK